VIGNRWYFDEMVGNAVHHDESLASWRLCCRVGQLRSCSSVVTLALGS
jgi:hypothetical protein